MKKLRKDAEKSPLSNILIILLLVIGFVSFPVGDIIKLFKIEYIGAAKYLSNAVFRLIFIGVMIYLVFCYGLEGVFRPKFKRLFLILPCFLVVINNFPIIALIRGEATVAASQSTVVAFIFYCLTVAAFEEIAFRGLIFPMCYFKLKDKKYGLFLSFFVSSATFGIVHLVNLLGGAGIVPVIMQIGYSFLIGGMCAIAMTVTGSIYVPIILHFVFNVGGLLIEETGVGAIWNTPTIIITAVLGAIVCVYMIIIALKTHRTKLEEIIGAPTADEETINKQ